MSGVRVEVEFAMVPEWLLFSDLTAQAIRVYAVLARRANYRTKRAFPSHREIADKARCSIATARRALAELTELGAIEVKHRRDDRGQTSNEYLVKVSRPLLMGEQAPLPMDEQPSLSTGEQGPLSTGERRNESHVEREVEVEKEPSPAKPVSALYTDRFEAFWTEYPLHEAKAAGARAFAKAIRRASLAEILDGVARYKAVLAADPDRPVKQASGWLNDDRWLDDAPPRPNGNGSRPPADDIASRLARGRELIGSAP